MPCRSALAVLRPPRPAVAFCLLSLLVAALPPPVRADTQFWMLASVTRSVSDRWRLSAEVAPRWERDASDYSRTVMRTQLARVFHGTVALGAGYEFQNPASLYVRREHRIWQQVQVQQAAGRWSVGHRARLEQRWLRDIDPLVLRARYQFRAARPIGGSRAWSWLLLDEVLYTVRGDSGAYPRGLDRHRLGAGVGRMLSPRLSVESGYTWQVINRPGGVAAQHDHLLALALSARY